MERVPKRVSPLSAVAQLGKSVLADYNSTRRYRAKYHADQIALYRLPVDLVRRIGFQTLAWVRVMQSADAAGVPLVPQVVSRLIRHAYGAEIHWRAGLSPGMSIVHGTGIVVSHRARVGPGCILFQNVTLGEGIDPETRETGAPTLGRDVHVGPGATLLGPIHVGDRTKIMAGAVLTKSVPPDSLVRPPESIVTARNRGKGAPPDGEAEPEDA
jgi:serine O-acetyltransferase